MPSIQASQIIARAKVLLLDDEVRHTSAEFLQWISDGQRDICTVVPGACVKSAVVSLQNGPDQTIPVDGVRIVSGECNVQDDGVTSGQAIRPASQRQLDAFFPGWRSSTRKLRIQHVLVEANQPKSFTVFPPAIGGNKIRITYWARPSDITSASQVISVEDSWMTALVDYVMYRALSKATEFAGNAERALVHRKAFADALMSNQDAKISTQ